MSRAQLSRARYRRHLITYVDVLGFRQRILATERDAALVPEVAALLDQVQGPLEVGGMVGEGKKGQRVRIFRPFNFSDLTVRCTRLLKYANVGDYFNWEILYLSEIQMSLACQGILLRGALCIGDLHTQPRAVFGPGLVKAYDLERGSAIFPRLVVDGALLSEAEQSPLGYWCDYITRGEDGVYFVHYLFGTALRLYQHPDKNVTEPSPGEWVRRHRKAVLDGLLRASKEPTVRQKYLWLALYHNRTVGDLKNRFAARQYSNLFDDCLISEVDLKFF